jgi:hypothetical protein
MGREKKKNLDRKTLPLFLWKWGGGGEIKKIAFFFASIDFQDFA